jgi:hypothetical protein
MRPEEGMYLAHRQGNPLLGFLPRVDAYFGIRREHRSLHGDGVGMRRDIIRQDQYGRLTKTEAELLRPLPLGSLDVAKVREGSG